MRKLTQNIRNIEVWIEKKTKVTNLSIFKEINTKTANQFVNVFLYLCDMNFKLLPTIKLY